MLIVFANKIYKFWSIFFNPNNKTPNINAKVMLTDIKISTIESSPNVLTDCNTASIETIIISSIIAYS